MLLVDGRVAGTWATERVGDVTTVTVTPFVKLPAGVVAAAERHLHERYATMLGPDLRLVVG